jgi:DNA-binding response OmpR family regulator
VRRRAGGWAGAEPAEARRTARRVADELRALVADLDRLRAENEALHARWRELLAALGAVSASLAGRSHAPLELEETGGPPQARRSRSVSWRGRTVSLAPREFALLGYLLDHPGRPLTRQALLDAVFPASSDTRSLRVHVTAIRSKLERLGPVPVRISTVRGIGYRLDLLRGTGVSAGPV